MKNNQCTVLVKYQKDMIQYIINQSFNEVNNIVNELTNTFLLDHENSSNPQVHIRMSKFAINFYIEEYKMNESDDDSIMALCAIIEFLKNINELPEESEVIYNK